MKYINEVFYDRRRDYLDIRNKDINPGEVDIVFLGDSITEGFNFSYAGVSNLKILNSGISGDRLFNLHHRIFKDAIDFKPKKIAIHIGINDLTSQENANEEYIEKMVNEYCNLIKIIKDNNIEPVCVCLIKIDQFCHNSIYINQLIELFNKNIIKYANDNNYKYVDYNEVLSDDYDSIEHTYFTDGLHLNERGYLEMFNLLKSNNII